MELFLFAVGNFLWKSILLTQHNKVDYLCSESPARGGGGEMRERQASNTFITELHPWLDSITGDPPGRATKKMAKAGFSSTLTKSSKQLGVPYLQINTP